MRMAPCLEQRHEWLEEAGGVLGQRRRRPHARDGARPRQPPGVKVGHEDGTRVQARGGGQEGRASSPHQKGRGCLDGVEEAGRQVRHVCSLPA